jgi:leucyl aminopeptidase (aminopeptidase T)
MKGAGSARPSPSAWADVATRAIECLGVQSGELIQIREHSGRSDVLVEMMLAIERAGATPLPELTPPEYLIRLLNDADHAYLATWDRHRIEWMRQVDRVLVLDGPGPDATTVPPAALRAWASATWRMTQVEDERRLPYVLVAVPTGRRATSLGLAERVLERHLLPALAAPPKRLRDEVNRVLEHLNGGEELILRTADHSELRLRVAGRRWLHDDGMIDAEDRAANAHISNLPAGSVYTTVIECSPTGELWLAEAVGAVSVRLAFEHGRIVDVAARSGRARMLDLLGRHTGDADRISHIGIGLNPHLTSFVGWPLVDEHVHGALFLALGENRYLGGTNESSLNMDFALPNATLTCDGKPIVEDGRLVV